MTTPQSSKRDGVFPETPDVDWRARERVEISLPIEPELWPLARMAASAVAVRVNLDFEEIEDLRLAINELCTNCASGAGPLSRLRLCLETGEDTLRAECVVDHLIDAGESDEPEVSLAGMTKSELSRRIMDELVDEHELGPVESGIRSGSLMKRRRTPSP